MIHVSMPSKIIILLVIVCAFLSFVNLLWGAPFFFHPDERNIIYSITQLNFPTQLNPHFFAYGSMPMYITFFLGLAIAKFRETSLTFDQALFMLRTISALLSIGTLISLYIISKKFWGISAARIAATLWTFSIGAIQFAHFGTFEMWQCFLMVWFFYFFAGCIKKNSAQHTFWMAVLLGLLVGTKVSYLPFLLFPFLLFLVRYFTSPKQEHLLHFFLTLLISGGIYALTNPFVLLDTKEFLDSIHYESSVALGTLPVFYTQGFLQTTPGIYQLMHVLPFLLNPVGYAAGIFSLFYVLFWSLRTRKADYRLLLLVSFIFFLFFSNAFLFVKWTRYMMPLLPFMYLLIAWCMQTLSATSHKILMRVCLFSLLAGSMLWSVAYTKTVFFSPDTRVSAAAWANTHLLNPNIVMGEPYDLGIIPFNVYFPHIQLPDMYGADTDQTAAAKVKSVFQNADVFILPSQRIMKARLSSPQLFPVTSPLYQSLFETSGAFTLVYQTPCDLLCKLTYWGDPLWFEETATVFDRPVVFIFKRT